MADSFAGAVVSLDWGDTDYLDITATKSDGTPQDLTGWSLTWTMKRSLADPDSAAVMKKTTAAGSIVVTNALGGLATINLLPGDYVNVPNKRSLYFEDLVGVDGTGSVNRLQKRKIQIEPVVTVSL